MLDSMISAMTPNFMTYLGLGKVPHPLWTTFAHIVPYCPFPTKDREVSIAAGSEKLWAVLRLAIGHPQLIDDPDYATNALRIKNRRVLEPMLADCFRQDTAYNWFQKLNAVGFPCSIVRTLDEVVQDPQAAVREMFSVLDHPTAGRFTVTGLPIKFSETPGRLLWAAPLLGQHTREAPSELLDLDPEKLEGLKAAGVISQPPEYSAQRT